VEENRPPFAQAIDLIMLRHVAQRLIVQADSERFPKGLGRERPGKALLKETRARMLLQEFERQTQDIPGTSGRQKIEAFIKNHEDSGALAHDQAAYLKVFAAKPFPIMANSTITKKLQDETGISFNQLATLKRIATRWQEFEEKDLP
jgi:hypothetical protein